MPQLTIRRQSIGRNGPLKDCSGASSGRKAPSNSQRVSPGAASLVNDLKVISPSSNKDYCVGELSIGSRGSRIEAPVAAEGSSSQEVRDNLGIGGVLVAAESQLGVVFTSQPELVVSRDGSSDQAPDPLSIVCTVTEGRLK